jgi:fatty acid desaturase
MRDAPDCTQKNDNIANVPDPVRNLVLCIEPQALGEQLVQTAHRLTRGLSERQPHIYWVDFLLTHSLGTVAFYLCATGGMAWPVRALFFAACVALWYRSFAFIHEIAHFRPGQMQAFQTVWNVLAGIPLLFPSFMYSIHLEHHSRSIYGTADDGEYIPWGVKPPVHILLFLLVSLAAPVLALFRLVVLVPITWLIPGSRAWVEQRASALVIRGSYRRPRPDRRELRLWRIQELCAVLWAFGVLLAGFSGYLSWRWFLTAMAALMAVSFINSFRTMLSHRFCNRNGNMTFLEQIEDSWNFPGGGLLTELLCPVGLRFHALHHMLPHLPYHSLPQAHAILMSTLPHDSLYRQTNSASLWSAMQTLWRGCRKTETFPA